MLPILTHNIRYEQDVVTARQRARLLSEQLGFDSQDQTRIATSVSEIARNAFRYAGGGKISFSLSDEDAPQGLQVVVADSGKGIEHLEEVLSGKYRSSTGMGLGLLGTRRLMDTFDIKSGASGTTITFAKYLGPRARVVGTKEIQEITRLLALERHDNPMQEVQQQNQELLRTLDELKARQEELSLLNRELEDTNRGVVALYAELDEKADHLRRADELKSRFLSNMSHEFRTPLNSILALSRILLERTDGELTEEQEIQINFIRKGAQDLSELVNDLLDLAKVEAGKIEIHPIEFEAQKLFGALRGMLRPLLLNESVQLVFEDVAHIPTLFTDEGKVSQILRNLISNALKYTERGEVRVLAEMSKDRKDVIFTVSDTGIGIRPKDHETIFQEFAQVDSPQQRKVKGTGLGLPLSRKLAELLGGTLTVSSTPGQGSTFTATIPRYYATYAIPDAEEWDALAEGEIPVLVLEDRPEEMLIYEKFLKATPYRVYPAYNTKEARAVIERVRPAAMILDILLKGEEGWHLLHDLKGETQQNDVPVIVITNVEDRGRAMALGAEAFFTKPLEANTLIAKLNELIAITRNPVALIIDDEEVSRYLLRQMLEETTFQTIQADNGTSGIQLAVREQPRVIFLDIVMPGMSGFDVLRQLRSRPETAGIPVIINSSKPLSPEERAELEGNGAVILSKEVATRSDAIVAMREALEKVGAYA